MGIVCFSCLIGTASVFQFGTASIAIIRSQHECKQPADRSSVVARIKKDVAAVLIVLGYCIYPLGTASMYCIYPTANTVFFQTFNCQNIDSTRFLRNDLSIGCSQPAHQTATVFAALMVLLFSVAFPDPGMRCVYQPAPQPGFRAAPGTELITKG
jgi:hypothetical protein